MAESEAKIHEIQTNSKGNEDDDEMYSYEKSTIIIGLQVLPEVDRTRKVLITSGIKGAPPVIISTSLQEITNCPVIAEILEKLKQALPQIAATAKRAKMQKIGTAATRTVASKVVPPPELPVANPSIQSDQLSLFK